MAVQTSSARILILGCGGFIGSHLLDRLLDDDKREIVGVDLRYDKIQHHLLNGKFTYVNGNVGDLALMRRCIAKSDVVILLAALCNPSLYNTKPVEVIESNFVGPYEVVKLCAQLRKWLIFFSSSEVYGRTVASLSAHGLCGAEAAQTLLREDVTPFILGPTAVQRWSYAAAKQLLERAVYGYGFERDLAYTIVRPFNFIGPRMDYIPGVDGEGVPRVVACFMDALMFGKPLQLVDGGINRRCFTYIDDAVDAIVRMLDSPDRAQKQIFNIGNPANDVSIAQLANMMIETYCELCPGARVEEFSTRVVSSYDFYGEGYEDSDCRVPDISKAYTLLGWMSKTDLRTALRLTMAAYIEQYAAVRECRASVA